MLPFQLCKDHPLAVKVLLLKKFPEDLFGNSLASDWHGINASILIHLRNSEASMKG